MGALRSLLQGILRGLVAVLVAGSLWVPVHAEDVEKRWRISLSLGGVDYQDEIQSDAANRLFLVNEEFLIEDLFDDPRDDTQVFGRLKVRNGPLATLAGQYPIKTFNSGTFIIEGSVGYQKSDVGNIEMQVQFDGTVVPEELNFIFETYNINAGEIERIPIHLSGLVRFRPRASFNPYIGLTAGYSVIGFEPSDEYNELSRLMDGSLGGQTTLSSAISGTPGIVPPSPNDIVDLQGATIDIGDTFEWGVVAGVEYTIKRNWAVLFDLRYLFSSRSVNFTFNEASDLGVKVPQFTDFVETSPFVGQRFGPVQITQGGLVDGGSLQPNPLAPADTDCTEDPQECFFDPTALDGELDTGLYYVQGGEFSYDSFSVQIGFRYTF